MDLVLKRRQMFSFRSGINILSYTIQNFSFPIPNIRGIFSEVFFKGTFCSTTISIFLGSSSFWGIPMQECFYLDWFGMPTSFRVQHILHFRQLPSLWLQFYIFIISNITLLYTKNVEAWCGTLSPSSLHLIILVFT